MRCERDWGRRDGVRVRCVKNGPHDISGCEVETPTQAVEAAVRAVLGDDEAQIVIRWANAKIVGILYNGAPLGKREWDACWAVSLPLVEWRGAPEDAWLISIGRAFRCHDCKQVVPSSQGADDDAPDACDACWAKRRVCRSEDQAKVDYWEIVDALRAMSPTSLAAMRLLMKAAAEAIADRPGASAEDTARLAGEILTLRPASDCSECGASLGSDGSCSRAPGHIPEEDRHAATLSAHCGCRPWEEMPELSKRLWRERARRLRVRWGVEEQDRLRALLEEMSERLNKDTDEHLHLREALRSEPEWINPCVDLISAAAVAISRLKRERDANAAVAIEAQGAAREALAQRDEFDKDRRDLRSACSAAVEAWERHGLAGLACHMYDLRAALEKKK